MSVKQSMLLASCLVASLSACEPARPVECGLGTILQDHTCVSAVGSNCPAGSVLVAGVCQSPLTCGAGTKEQLGQCVPSGTTTTVTCGTGTQLQGSECVPSNATVTCGANTQLLNGVCVASNSSVTCGTGTQLQGTQCLPTAPSLTCGSGTTLQGTQCVASTTTVTCGTGTALVSGRCQVNLTSVCSTDTTGAGGDRCVGTLMCGSGTTRTGSQCTAATSSTVTCGPGTTLQGTTCVIAPASTTLAAFLGQMTNTQSVAWGSTGANDDRAAVISELSQGNADAWVNTGNAMIGTGRALHLSGFSYLSTASTTTYLTVRDDTTVGVGGVRVCSPGLAPFYGGNTGLRVGLFSWSGGAASPVLCAYQGTVKYEQYWNSTAQAYRPRLTLNVAFHDGTTLVDHVISF